MAHFREAQKHTFCTYVCLCIVPIPDHYVLSIPQQFDLSGRDDNIGYGFYQSRPGQTDIDQDVNPNAGRRCGAGACSGGGCKCVGEKGSRVSTEYDRSRTAHALFPPRLRAAALYT